MNTATLHENRQTQDRVEEAPQRDDRGRFARGNNGGPGNPFARRVALLRKLVLEVVSAEDLEAIVRKLVELAREGDVAAARLVMGYTLGKPAEAVDPDRMDIEEWKLNQEKSVNPLDFGAVLNSFPAQVASKLADITWPCLLNTNLLPLRKGLERLNAKDERRRQHSAANGSAHGRQSKDSASAAGAEHRQQTAGNGWDGGVQTKRVGN